MPTKRGGRWHPTTVARLLDDDASEADRQTAARLRRVKAEAKAHRQGQRAAAFIDLPTL